jgi:hypothetical protein
LPNDIETGFTERANFGPEGSATFPSGAHVAEVEIDAETGTVALTRYTAVDDCGVVLNPRADNFCFFEFGQQLSARPTATRSASRASARPAPPVRSRR